MQNFINSFPKKKDFKEWAYPLLGYKSSYMDYQFRRWNEKKNPKEFEALILGAKCLEQKVTIHDLEPITIKKEKDYFCLYQNDKRIMMFDNAERALEAIGASKGIIAPNRENELFL